MTRLLLTTVQTAWPVDRVDNFIALSLSSCLTELFVRDGDFRTRFRAAIGDTVHAR